MTDEEILDTPESLLIDMQAVKDIAAKAPVVMKCSCGFEQPVSNTICPACGADLS